MKNIILFLLLNMTVVSFIYAQKNKPTDQQRKDISALIDQYSEAREKQDTFLLKKILSDDIDQLVSTGEWRDGISASIQGMLKSSAGSPGTRTLHIEKLRMLGNSNAIVDCRYEIKNKDGSARKMWSTFIVIAERGNWKISAIRNMLPSEK